MGRLLSPLGLEGLKSSEESNLETFILQNQSACCTLFPCMDVLMEHLDGRGNNPLCGTFRRLVAWVSNFCANNSGLISDGEKAGNQRPRQL